MTREYSNWPTRLASFCLLSVMATPVLAVDPPTPGAVQQPFKQPALTAPSSDDVTPDVEGASKARKPTGSTKRIKVKRFEISGNQAIPTAELLALIKDLAGKELTLDEIYAASDILTEYYRGKGYSLAKVVVPAQRVSFGIIQMQVIEGRLNAVKLEGQNEYDEEALRAYLGSLQLGQIVTLEALERELLLLNDLPGLKARAVVRPGPAFGTSDLVLKSEEKPYEGRVSVTNYGRVEVGEWRLEGEFIYNNLSGRGDQLGVFATHAESGLLEFVSVSYNFPLNSRGTRIGAVLSHIDYEVGGEFEALDIEGDNTDFQLTLSHPLQRSKRQNILVGLGIGRNDTRARTLGVTTSDRDINLLEGSILLNRIHDDNSTSSVSAVLSTNFRDNDDGQRNNAQKAKLVVEGSHLRSFAKDWSLYLRGVIAASADPLVDSEKYSIGGPGSVRGYPAAEVRGDQGYEFTAEVRRSFSWFGELPASGRLFFDTGKVSRKRPAVGEDEETTLTSLGLGMSLAIHKSTTLDLEYARPIDAGVSSDRREGGRVWFNLTSRF